MGRHGRPLRLHHRHRPRLPGDQWVQTQLCGDEQRNMSWSNQSNVADLTFLSWSAARVPEELLDRAGGAQPHHRGRDQQDGEIRGGFSV